MIKYSIKRIFMIIPIILGVTLVLFILLYSLSTSTIKGMPSYGGGDALDSIFGFFSAGDNFFTKYIRYCYNIFFHFNFGKNSATMRRLTEELSYRARNTLFILFSGAAVTMAVGIPAGVYSAARKDRAADRVLNTASLILSAIPNYAVATLLTLGLVVYIRLIPLFTTDYRSPVAYILPSLTIMLGGVASVLRMTRASMIEVLDRPYITALRSKGLKERDVIWKHALKNAAIPTVAVLGGLISSLLCGTLVVEYFFGVPGLGSFMLRGVALRDHIAILGCTVLMTVILSVINTIADIIYAFINPQIRLRYTARRGRD